MFTTTIPNENLKYLYVVPNGTISVLNTVPLGTEYEKLEIELC